MADVLWDPKTNTFIAAGRKFGHPEVRKWIEDAVDHASELLDSVVSSAMLGDISATEFASEFGDIVSDLQIATAVIAAGGDEQFEGDAFDAAEDRLSFQLGRVDAFAGDVREYQQAIDYVAEGDSAEEFDVISEAEALARSEMYANAGIGAYENAVRVREAESGNFNEECRLRVDDENSCQDCIDWDVDHYGWAPIATVIPDIGDVACMVNDRCSFGYRNTVTGEEDVEEKGLLINKTDGPHKFSCVMADLPEAEANAVLALAATIPDEELAEDGRESQIHVTVLYGLHSQTSLGARSMLTGQPPITLELLGVSIFEANDKHDYDVVKMDVKSDDLYRLNTLLKELPHTSTFDYHPHVTLAYVKAGKGQQYVGMENELTGKQIVIDSVVFSSWNNTQDNIRLTGTVHEVGGMDSVSKYSDDQPRDDNGRWTSGGGSADIPKGPYETVATADEALAALAEGRYVELEPEQVGIVLERMAAVAREAEAMGKEAPRYNLCNVSVDGTSPFCGSGANWARIEMPRIPRKDADGFKEYLKENGIEFEKDKVRVDKLKASQTEIDGSKVAKIMEDAKGGRTNQVEARIFVSKDNFVIDGHHKWAAVVGLDYGNKKLGDMKMKVTRVNLPVTALYKVANDYTDLKGYQRQKSKY